MGSIYIVGDRDLFGNQKNLKSTLKEQKEMFGKHRTVKGSKCGDEKSTYTNEGTYITSL